MDSRRRSKYLPMVAVALAAAGLLTVGCSDSDHHTYTRGDLGSSFVVGTDAPPSANVASFTVQVQNICAVTIDAKTNVSECVPLVNGWSTVDFARYNGLQTLLDMNDVLVGSYTQIQITLGPATIGYLTTGSGAPTISTEQASYASPCATTTSCTYTATLASPFVVSATGAPNGLRVDFDLRKSIGVDGSGNITGAVTPTFEIAPVATTDAGGYIDTFATSVLGVGTSSFVVQGPHGEYFTVNVSGTTTWENSATISTLTAGSIVDLSGKLDAADQTLDADDVAILSQDGFYADGLVTFLHPSPSNVSPALPPVGFDLYVRGLELGYTGVTLGDIATVALSGSETYFVDWKNDSLTQFKFNASELVPGQRVTVDGTVSGAAKESAVSVKQLALRPWGYNGTVVPGSENTSAGTFQIAVNGLGGALLPQKVTVYATAKTGFRGTLAGIGSVTGSANVRVVGLLLNDPTAGTVLVAHYVDSIN